MGEGRKRRERRSEMEKRVRMRGNWREGKGRVEVLMEEEKNYMDEREGNKMRGEEQQQR